MDGTGMAAAADPPAVEQGYRVERLLGAGGRARVWLAVREDDGARFALKIAAGAGSGPGSTFEMRRELNILSRFGHENLLRLHTVLDTGRGPGLLMEYAPGDSLARLAVVRGTLTPGEAVTVLAGIASALEYLHDQGITHGHVSPDNILFSARGKPLLADLGMASLIGSRGREAPVRDEFADPGAGTGPEADIYSLAAVGWFVLTGQLPPDGEHRRDPGETAAGIPPALATALEAGLQADPQLRPDAAGFGALVLGGAAFAPVNPALPGWVGGLEADSFGAQDPEAGALAMDEPNSVRRPRRSHRGRRQPQRNRGRTLQTDSIRKKAAARNRRIPRPETDQLGLDPLTPVRHPWLVRRRLRPRPVRAERTRLQRPALAAAALLVAATMGLGVIAVAAPELLMVPDNDAVVPEDTEARENTAVREDPVVHENPVVPADQPVRADPVVPGEEAPEGEAQVNPVSTATMEELARMRRSDDPVRAVPALAELRNRAFLAADPAQLESVNVPGSPAMAADAAELEQLKNTGTVLSGLAVEVLSAGPAEESAAVEEAATGGPGGGSGGVPGQAPGRVSVRTVVSTSAYSERKAGGGLVRTVAALPRQDLVLVLGRSPDGWRIEDILAPR